MFNTSKMTSLVTYVLFHLKKLILKQFLHIKGVKNEGSRAITYESLLKLNYFIMQLLIVIHYTITSNLFVLIVYKSLHLPLTPCRSPVPSGETTAVYIGKTAVI